MIVFIISFAISCIILSTYIYSVLKINLKDQIESDFKSYEKLCESTLKYNNILDANTENVIQSTIDSIKSNVNAYLGFYDEKGSYINSFGDIVLNDSINELLDMGSKDKSILQYADYEKMTATYIQPIYLRGNFKYYLIIQQKYTDNYNKIISVVKSVIIAQVILIAVVSLFLSLKMNKIIKPLLKLSREMKNYGDGIDVHSLPVQHNDEVGQATKAFNEMMIDKKKLESLSRDFFNNSTHELKTPVTAIYAYAQVLQEENLEEIDPEFKKRALDRMVLECIKLKDLIQKLLEISRNGVKKPGKKENINLNSIIMNLTDRLKVRCNKTGKNILLNLQDVNIMAVKDDIEDLIMNLLDNSIKYSKDSNIKVKLIEENTNFKLTIENNIEKIPEDIKFKLLEPFVKYNSYKIKREETITSSGVGLYLCSQLAQNNNLKLSYEIYDDKDSIKFTLTNN